MVLAADLSDEAERDRMAARLEELGAAVEILVNNAGFGLYQPFAQAGRERELQQVKLLVEAVVDLTARYLPGMQQRKRAEIINMSSTAGLQPLPYNAGYSAAKGYVLLLSEAVNAEVHGSDVTVTAVCPVRSRRAFRPPTTRATSRNGYPSSPSSPRSKWRAMRWRRRTLDVRR